MYLVLDVDNGKFRMTDNADSIKFKKGNSRKTGWVLNILPKPTPHLKTLTQRHEKGLPNVDVPSHKQFRNEPRIANQELYKYGQ